MNNNKKNNNEDEIKTSAVEEFDEFDEFEGDEDCWEDNDFFADDMMYAIEDENQGRDHFVRCNPEKLMKKQDLYLAYPEGKVIAYFEAGDNLRIFAEGEVVHNKTVPGDYRDAVNWVCKPAERSCRISIVPPIPKSFVDGSFIFMTRDEFYKDENHNIENHVNMLKKVYDAQNREIRLYVRGYSRGVVSDYILFYGVSCERISRASWNRIGTDTSEMQYIHYLGQKTRYLQSLKEKELKQDSQTSEKPEAEQDIHAEAMKEKLLSPICYDIRRWLIKTPFDSFYEEIAKTVIGQEGLKKVLFFVYKYLSNISRGKAPLNRNIIMTAGSGQGKTETYRALKNYFKGHIPGMPVIIFDISQLTEAGYKGKEVRAIFAEIFSNKQYMEAGGIGLFFLDEIDKKIISNDYDKGFNNAAISNLLVTLEGNLVYADRDEEGPRINTALSMFIGLGSFDYVRKARAKKKDAVIGFGKETAEESKDHFYKITKQDMINAGGTYELVGRFCSVINYSKLSYEAVDHIIDKVVRIVSDDLDYKIILTAKMRELLHTHSSSKYGCRQLDSIVREAAVDCLLDEEKNQKILESFRIVLDVPTENTFELE